MSYYELLWCAWVLSKHVPVPCLSWRLESGHTGLNELAVPCWKPLAELELEEGLLPFPQKHPYFIFATTSNTISGRCVQMWDSTFVEYYLWWKFAEFLTKSARDWCLAFHFRVLLWQGQILFTRCCTGLYDHEASGEKVAHLKLS